VAHVLTVSVGTPREVEWDANLGRSAMEKQSVTGPVAARTRGLDGDQVADTRFHGGVDQAVYAFAREDLDRWEEVLGRPIPDGHFGENLTTTGLDVNEALVGERWAIGSAVLEVAMVRTPCRDFQRWQRHTGYDARAWVKRFAAEARPGPYLRVVQEGELQAGDPITVVHRPAHDVTVSTMFRALTTDRDLLPRLLEVDDLARVARRRVDRYLATHAPAPAVPAGPGVD
jgi:MOSC domain-containing protein YiiM